MDDLKQRIEAVLRGADVKYVKPKQKLKESEEIEEEHDFEESDDNDEFEFKSESEMEKNHPDYKQDVALIRTMLNKKFKEKLGQLRGKSSYGS
jgi:hypothetical protein